MKQLLFFVFLCPIAFSNCVVVLRHREWSKSLNAHSKGTDSIPQLFVSMQSRGFGFPIPPVFLITTGKKINKFRASVNRYEPSNLRIDSLHFKIYSQQDSLRWEKVLTNFRTTYYKSQDPKYPDNSFITINTKLYSKKIEKEYEDFYFELKLWYFDTLKRKQKVFEIPKTKFEKLEHKITSFP